MSVTRKTVKNHAVGDEVRGRKCVDWKDGITEERKSLHVTGDCHNGNHKGRHGEGGSGAHAHVKKIDDSVRRSVKADKKVKFTPLQLPNYSRGKSDRAQEMKEKMSQKITHNMTYDYLDAITCSSNAPKVIMKTNLGPS